MSLGNHVETISRILIAVTTTTIHHQLPRTLLYANLSTIPSLLKIKLLWVPVRQKHSLLLQCPHKFQLYSQVIITLKFLFSTTYKTSPMRLGNAYLVLLQVLVKIHYILVEISQPPAHSAGPPAVWIIKSILSYSINKLPFSLVKLLAIQQ